MNDTSSFRVGRYRCTMTCGDRGIEVQWYPRLPKHFTKAEKRAYRAGRAAFLTQAFPGRKCAVLEVA